MSTTDDYSRWNVYHVYYLTYAEIDAMPEPRRTLAIEGRDRELVARNLKFSEAKKMVDALGFGHSMHPAS